MVECKVDFDYDAEQDDELTIRPGDIIKNVHRQDGGWWQGELNGKRGVFPDNFVKVITKSESKKTGAKSKDSTKKDSNTTDDFKMAANHESDIPRSGHVRELKNALSKQVSLSSSKKGKKKSARVRATESYNAEEDDELSFVVGDIIEVTDKDDENWWRGHLLHKDTVAAFPVRYTETMDDDVEVEGAEGVEITGKKVKGVGLGDIFKNEPIKLRTTGSKKEEKTVVKPAQSPAEESVPLPPKPIKPLTPEYTDNTSEFCLPAAPPCTLRTPERQDKLHFDDDCVRSSDPSHNPDIVDSVLITRKRRSRLSKENTPTDLDLSFDVVRPRRVVFSPEIEEYQSPITIINRSKLSDNSIDGNHEIYPIIEETDSEAFYARITPVNVFTKDDTAVQMDDISTDFLFQDHTFDIPEDEWDSFVVPISLDQSFEESVSKTVNSEEYGNIGISDEPIPYFCPSDDDESTPTCDGTTQTSRDVSPKNTNVVPMCSNSAQDYKPLIIPRIICTAPCEEQTSLVMDRPDTSDRSDNLPPCQSLAIPFNSVNISLNSDQEIIPNLERTWSNSDRYNAFKTLDEHIVEVFMDKEEDSNCASNLSNESGKLTNFKSLISDLFNAKTDQNYKEVLEMSLPRKCASGVVTFEKPSHCKSSGHQFTAERSKSEVLVSEGKSIPKEYPPVSDGVSISVADIDITAVRSQSDEQRSIPCLRKTCASKSHSYSGLTCKPSPSKFTAGSYFSALEAGNRLPRSIVRLGALLDYEKLTRTYSEDLKPIPVVDENENYLRGTRSHNVEVPDVPLISTSFACDDVSNTEDPGSDSIEEGRSILKSKSQTTPGKEKTITKSKSLGRYTMSRLAALGSQLRIIKPKRSVDDCFGERVEDGTQQAQDAMTTIFHAKTSQQLYETTLMNINPAEAAVKVDGSDIKLPSEYVEETTDSFKELKPTYPRRFEKITYVWDESQSRFFKEPVRVTIESSLRSRIEMAGFDVEYATKADSYSRANNAQIDCAGTSETHVSSVPLAEEDNFALTPPKKKKEKSKFRHFVKGIRRVKEVASRRFFSRRADEDHSDNTAMHSDESLNLNFDNSDLIGNIMMPEDLCVVGRAMRIRYPEEIKIHSNDDGGKDVSYHAVSDGGFKAMDNINKKEVQKERMEKYGKPNSKRYVPEVEDSNVLRYDGATKHDVATERSAQKAKQSKLKNESFKISLDKNNHSMTESVQSGYQENFLAGFMKQCGMSLPDHHSSSTSSSSICVTPPHRDVESFRESGTFQGTKSILPTETSFHDESSAELYSSFDENTPIDNYYYNDLFEEPKYFSDSPDKEDDLEMMPLLSEDEEQKVSRVTIESSFIDEVVESIGSGVCMHEFERVVREVNSPDLNRIADRVINYAVEAIASGMEHVDRATGSALFADVEAIEDGMENADRAASSALFADVEATENRMENTNPVLENVNPGLDNDDPGLENVDPVLEVGSELENIDPAADSALFADVDEVAPLCDYFSDDDDLWEPLVQTEETSSRRSSDKAQAFYYLGGTTDLSSSTDDE